MGKKKRMPADKQIFAYNNSILSAGSAVAISMLVQPFLRELIPSSIFRGLKSFIFARLQNLVKKLSPFIIIMVKEFNELAPNQYYFAAETYLRSISLTSAKTFEISKTKNDKNHILSIEKIEEIVDVFEGVRVRWKCMTTRPHPGDNSSYINSSNLGLDYSIKQRASAVIRYFELSFHKKHKEKVVNSYLPYILEIANSLKEKRPLKLHTVNDRNGGYSYNNPWCSITLDHPATFDKLAMEDATKKMIIEDLERFVKRKNFYRKVGKVWKRGYLLYGPPGTGKSSLIAAMANYMNFDIYDLELTDIRRNSDLRRLLVSTANRSILVIEDIDCSLDFNNPRPSLPMNNNPRLALPVNPNKLEGEAPTKPPPTDIKQLTLSGMLNFIDGLWSSCGDERIIVFSTNKMEVLDPALLRPGRMDVHIHMSYCTPSGIRLLANNYFNVSDHPAFQEIEQSLETAKVTPAEVCEILLKNDDPDTSIENLVGFLRGRTCTLEYS